MVKNVISTIVAGAGLMLPLAAQAALLSGNNTGNDAPGNSIAALATGATYSYVTGTDADVINQDPSLGKLTNGTSEKGGGSSAVYGGWDSAQSSGYSIMVEFDLKNVYSITSVVSSVAFTIGADANNRGVGKSQVYVSTDGVSYSLAGTILDITPVSNVEEARNTLLTLNLASAIDARYVRISYSRLGTDSLGYWYHQAVVGEVAIYGDAAVPEPASLSLAMLALPMMYRKRKSA